jgi:hypothetical protein
MRTNRWTPRDLALALALLGVGLLLVLPNGAGARGSRDEWPAAARTTAGTVAQRWAASVRTDARLGAEPTGACRRLDARHAACPIAIAVLARGDSGRSPWRCEAEVLVARAGGELVTRRAHTRCTPFPPPSGRPDAAGAIGTAVALNANGDVSCLAASGARLTCAMRYVAPGARHCIGAASVPLAHPARALALGTPRCRGGHAA